jgi:hypothetical protein
VPYDFRLWSCAQCGDGYLGVAQMVENPYKSPSETIERPIIRSRLLTYCDIAAILGAASPVLFFLVRNRIASFMNEAEAPSLYFAATSHRIALLTFLACLICLLYNANGSLKRRWLSVIGLAVNIATIAWVVYKMSFYFNE